MKPKEAYDVLYNLICGQNGMRLTLPDHQLVQQAFQTIQKDMSSFKREENKDD